MTAPPTPPTPTLAVRPLPVRPAPPVTAPMAAWSAYAAAVLGDIATTRAAVTTPAEHGAYEAARQAALVIAEAGERLVLARLQLERALADLATVAPTPGPAPAPSPAPTVP